MHVIPRRENEAIVINDRIIVTVKEINEDSICLSIETPDEEPFYREEVLYFAPQYA